MALLDFILNRKGKEQRPKAFYDLFYAPEEKERIAKEVRRGFETSDQEFDRCLELLLRAEYAHTAAKNATQHGLQRISEQAYDIAIQRYMDAGVGFYPRAAAVARERGDLETTIALYREAGEKLPFHGSYLSIAASLLVQIGKPEEAMKIYERHDWYDQIIPLAEKHQWYDKIIKAGLEKNTPEAIDQAVNAALKFGIENSFLYFEIQHDWDTQIHLAEALQLPEERIQGIYLKAITYYETKGEHTQNKEEKEYAFYGAARFAQKANLSERAVMNYKKSWAPHAGASFAEEREDYLTALSIYQQIEDFYSAARVAKKTGMPFKAAWYEMRGYGALLSRDFNDFRKSISQDLRKLLWKN